MSYTTVWSWQLTFWPLSFVMYRVPRDQSMHKLKRLTIVWSFVKSCCTHVAIRDTESRFCSRKVVTVHKTGLLFGMPPSPIRSKVARYGHFRHTPILRNCGSFGCVLLLNQIYLTTIYRSKIPLRFIGSICSGSYGVLSYDENGVRMAETQTDRLSAHDWKSVKWIGCW